MKTGILAYLFLTFFFLQGYSQSRDTIKLKAVLVDGDTVPTLDLTEITIISPTSKTDPEEINRIARLIRAVRIAYPYAKLAKNKMIELNDKISKVESKGEKRRIIKQAEEEIKSRYGSELKNLTFSQGKVLIKLLDRETGNSSFDLVKEFKGGFMAFFWQSFAGLWGYDLKTKYDPNGEDKEIELIVHLIETGGI